MGLSLPKQKLARVSFCFPLQSHPTHVSGGSVRPSGSAGSLRFRKHEARSALDGAEGARGCTALLLAAEADHGRVAQTLLEASAPARRPGVSSEREATRHRSNGVDPHVQEKAPRFE